MADAALLNRQRQVRNLHVASQHRDTEFMRYAQLHTH